jgi:hypothetical protein
MFLMLYTAAAMRYSHTALAACWPAKPAHSHSISQHAPSFLLGDAATNGQVEVHTLVASTQHNRYAANNFSTRQQLGKFKHRQLKTQEPYMQLTHPSALQPAHCHEA